MVVRSAALKLARAHATAQREKAESNTAADAVERAVIGAVRCLRGAGLARPVSRD